LHLKRDVVGVHLIHPAPADDLLKRRSKVFEQAFVNIVNIAIRPRPPHQCGDSFDQGLQILLTKDMSINN